MVLNSSTPDGLAPLSNEGFIIVISIFSGLSILWGLLNFLRLWQEDTEAQHKQLLSAREMSIKILLGSLQYMKLNGIVIILICIVFYLLIMGTVQKFQRFQLSTVYLIGVFAALLSSFYIVIVSALSYFRIVNSSLYSTSNAFLTAKFASNSITFTSLGIIFSSFLGLFIYFKPEQNYQPESIIKFSSIFINFSFGWVGVTICTKITSLVYSKGSQNSFLFLRSFNDNFPADDKSPMIICKTIGENINKSLSKTLDFLALFCILIALTIKTAGMNIIGADQQGEIIFKLAYQNTYIAMVVLAFSIFFTLLFSIVQGGPNTQKEVQINFMVKIAGISSFLFGFTALACYLTLPAEFIIKSFVEQGNTKIDSPLFAYLSCLIGMVMSILLCFSAEVIGTSPFFIYSLLRSCKTGGATCIISGLSMGYMYNLIPAVSLSAFGFLCYYWMGMFGVAMGSLGFGVFIPYYMNVNLYHSIMNSASMMGFVNQIQDQTITNLLILNESKKYFQQKVLVHSNCLTGMLGYLGVGIFVQYVNLSELSICDGYVFAGLLIGSMFPYIWTGSLIKASLNVSGILCYEIQEQCRMNPGIEKGQVQIQFYGSSRTFVLYSILQIIKFVPLIIFPYILGLLMGVKILIGFIAGVGTNSLYLAIASSISGVLWGNLRDEISYGRAKDQDNNDIPLNSELGGSAETGKNLSINLKDCAGQGCQILLVWVVLCNQVFQDFFNS